MSDALTADEPLADAETAQTEAVDTAELERQARVQGWRPEDEFKGDKTQWVDAQTFVERGKTILPFLQANNKAMERTIKTQNERLERLEATLKQQYEFSTKAEQRSYERARAELTKEIEQAVEANDPATVKAATDDLIKLEKEARTPEPIKAPASDAPDPIVEDWIEKNPWFNTDPVMQASAKALSAIIDKEGVTDISQNLAEVAKRIRAEFPHKFENPRRNAPPAVEGSSPQRTVGKGFSDLPADAKEMCDSLIKAGVKGLTRAGYAKEFFGQ